MRRDRIRKIVSDHAVVRYLERVQGFDIDAVREAIVTPEVEKAIELGATKVRSNGVEYRIKCGMIATIIER